MDLRDRIEIFIPAEAEVKTIPLWSLPTSVLRRMGLPVSDSSGSKKLTNSPKATWICPAAVRRKGQKAGSGVVENTRTLLSRECRASSGPFRMSFVFSNHTAFKVLKDTVPGSKLSTNLPHTTSLPQGLASKTYQTAVVVYAGRIYLSVRKPGRGPGQREAARPVPSARRQPQKKELLRDKTKPKKKRASCKVTHNPNKKGSKHRDVSSCVAQSSVSEEARAKQNPEAVAVQQPDWCQPQEEVANDCGESVMQDLSSEEAERVSQNPEVDSNVQSASGDVDPSSTQSWTRREPPAAAFTSTSLQNKFDFEDLADEEMIARMKARLKHNAQFLTSAQSD